MLGLKMRQFEHSIIPRVEPGDHLARRPGIVKLRIVKI
jgi:hypothetical protein